MKDVKKIKELQKELIIFIQVIDGEFDDLMDDDEYYKAFEYYDQGTVKLQMSVSWLAEQLREMGVKHPENPFIDPETNIVEKTAAEGVLRFYNEIQFTSYTHIQVVKFIRKVIEDIVMTNDIEYQDGKLIVHPALLNFETNLKEAKFLFGYCLPIIENIEYEDEKSKEGKTVEMKGPDNDKQQKPDESK